MERLKIKDTLSKKFMAFLRINNLSDVFVYKTDDGKIQVLGSDQIFFIEDYRKEDDDRMINAVKTIYFIEKIKQLLRDNGLSKGLPLSPEINETVILVHCYSAPPISYPGVKCIFKDAKFFDFLELITKEDLVIANINYDWRGYEIIFNIKKFSIV